MLLNFALSTNMVPQNSKMMTRRRQRHNIEHCYMYAFRTSYI